MNDDMNNGFDAGKNRTEDYSDARKYNYNPMTGERNVYYGCNNGSENNYSEGRAGQYYTYSQDNKQPKKKKSGKAAIIALVIVGTLLFCIATGSIIKGVLTSSKEEITEDKSAETETSEDNKLDYTLGNSAASGLLNSEVDLTQIASKTIESVVCIENYQNYDSQFQGFIDAKGASQLYGEGSGVIITEDGYVITNQHVIDGCDALQVIMSSGEIYDAELIGEDEVSDLALIKIKPEKDVKFSPIVIGDSDALSVAEYALAVGNPGGSEFSSTVTLGIISAKDRPITISSGYTINMLQTDAAINPGNSGGALVNMKGELIGICSAKYVATGYENMGFAITINDAMPIIEELRQYGYVKSRGALPIEYQVVDSAMSQYYNIPTGLYVTSIEKECGDVEVRDIITEIDGMSVSGEAALSNALAGKSEGDSVTIRYYDMQLGKYYETQANLVESKMRESDSSENDSSGNSGSQYGDYSDYYNYYKYFFGRDYFNRY